MTGLNDEDPVDHRPGMPVRELLELMQDDPIDLAEVAYKGGCLHGVDPAIVRAYVVNTLESPLRAGWIHPIHFYNTGVERFLTEDLSPDEIPKLETYALPRLADEAYDTQELDFWFESTQAGDDAWRTMIGDRERSETKNYRGPTSH